MEPLGPGWLTKDDLLLGGAAWHICSRNRTNIL